MNKFGYKFSEIINRKQIKKISIIVFEEYNLYFIKKSY